MNRAIPHYYDYYYTYQLMLRNLHIHCLLNYRISFQVIFIINRTVNYQSMLGYQIIIINLLYKDKAYHFGVLSSFPFLMIVVRRSALLHLLSLKATLLLQAF